MRKLIAGGLTGVLAVILGALMFASAAFATPHHPTGEFEQFGDCPLNRESITDCVYSVTSSGSFTIGNKTVPIENPVTLQGGYEGFGEGIEFYGAEDGNTLSETAQPVPGGLLGITAPTWWPIWIQEWFNNGINEGLTGVTATVKLTGPTSGLTNIHLNTGNLLAEKGTALGLPVKIKLSNALLGSNCYIGSNSSPVQINFTSGTTEPPPPNEPISGSAGTFEANEEFTLLTFTGGKLVNNSFSAPGVSGCGGIFSFLVDPLVDSILGTPSAAGHNTAVLEGKIQDAASSAVRESE